MRRNLKTTSARSASSAVDLILQQALPTTDPIANPVHSFMAKTQCAAT